MKKHRLKFINNETAYVFELDDGTFPCPICGDPWPHPAYRPNDGILGPVYPVSTPSIGDICEGCDVEFGFDEGVGPSDPIGTMRAVWARLRVEWLDRVNWNPAALEQLRDNLGITEEEVRREAEALGKREDPGGDISHRS